MLHIGGQFAQELGDYHQRGLDPIIFVEGDPENYGIMEKEMKAFNEKHNINSIPVFALITDQDDKEYDFNRHILTGTASSIFKVNPVKWKKKWTSREEKVIKLKSKTVTAILKELNIQPGVIKHLVVDVQGAELLVFKGISDEYFDHIETIFTEISTKQFYIGAVKFNVLNEFLESKGFKCQATKIPDHGNVLYKRV